MSATGLVSTCPELLIGTTKHLTVIGLDFGTKHSRVGVVRNGEFEIILDEKGRSVVPSVVAFTGDGKHLVGFEAKEYTLENPKSAIHDIKYVTNPA